MVEALLSWRDPIQSGVVFGALNLFFFLTVMFDYSVITMFCYIFLSVSGVGILLNYMGKDD